VEEDDSGESSAVTTPGAATTVLETPRSYSEKIDEKSGSLTVVAKGAPRQTLDDVEHPFDAETLRYLRK
jgi:hypothetical protein